MPGYGLHCVSHEAMLHWAVNLATTVEFGSAHLQVIGNGDDAVEVPIGTAHFMEHFLFWRHFDSHVCAFADTYTANPNAAVFSDLTRWGVRHANCADFRQEESEIDKDKRDQSISNILSTFLSIICDESMASVDIEERIVWTRNDVANELRERYTLSYRLQLALLQSLYHSSNLSADGLGTRESLSHITRDHVKLAERLIPESISSVMIVGTDIRPSLQDELLDHLRNRATKTGQIAVSAPPIEPAHIVERIGILDCDYIYDVTHALVGVKLPPIHEAFGQLDRQRQQCLQFMAQHMSHGPLQSMSNRYARCYLRWLRIECHPAFIDDITLRQKAKTAVDQIAGQLRNLRNNLSKHKRLLVCSLGEGPSQFMKFGLAGIQIGCDIGAFLEVLEAIQAADVDQMISEFEGWRHNHAIVYAGGF